MLWVTFCAYSLVRSTLRAFERLKHTYWSDPVGIGCWQNLEQSISKMRRETWNYEISGSARIKSESAYNRYSWYRKYVLVSYRGFSLTVSLFWHFCICIMSFGVGFQVKMTCPIQTLVTVEVNLHIPKSRLVKNSFVVRSFSLSRKRSWKPHKPVQLPERQGSCTNLTLGWFFNFIVISSTFATPGSRDQLRVDQKTLRSSMVWGCKKVWMEFPSL